MLALLFFYFSSRVAFQKYLDFLTQQLFGKAYFHPLELRTAMDFNHRNYAGEASLCALLSPHFGVCQLLSAYHSSLPSWSL